MRFAAGRSAFVLAGVSGGGDGVLRQFDAAVGGAELVIAHADRPQIAAELVERMRPLVSGEPSLTVVGPVVGCHSGPGAIGVGFNKPLP